MLMQQNQPSQYSSMEQEIVQFINNPTEDNTEKIYDNLSKLCLKKYQSQIEYHQSKYCALTGVELTENAIKIEKYYFSPVHIQQYYQRNGILDVSIGDLKFSYYDGTGEELATIELTWEMLQAIYGDNLNQLLEQAYNHFNKRFDQSNPPIYQETGRSGVISESSQKIQNNKESQDKY